MNRKKVLGRGMSALIGDGRATEVRAGQKYLMCALADITPNKVQPRKTFSDAALKELSDSIREKGVIEPLIIRRNPAGGFELIAGERRWRAARMAGLKEAPAMILDVSDEESLELAIIENIQREDLNAIEEAEAYRNLMGFGLSQEEVAKKVGKERATVANYLRLLKLPPEVKEELLKGTITMGHARAILALENQGAQAALCAKIIAKGLSVREAEVLAGGKAKKTAVKTNRQSNSQNFLEDELRGIFGTKIAVNDKNGKGRIEILYFSADERERIIDMLRSVTQ
ncbi:MAG: ParB/RepB/Spo0J family partition protein [Deltaproteobacteria bacterium]|nr:ParB/RepB/Spo0J family partition protein [Deltaproteobacteria bacterium]